jgi:hypothetical protein
MPKKTQPATQAQIAYVAANLGLSDDVLIEHTGLAQEQVTGLRQQSTPLVNPTYDRPATGVVSMTAAASQRSDDYLGPTTITNDIINLAERNGQTDLLPRLRQLQAAGHYDHALVREVLYGNSQFKIRPS